MVCSLERIFSPIAVSDISDLEIEKIASGSASVKIQRVLQDRIIKLERGGNTFRLSDPQGRDKVIVHEKTQN